MHLLAATPGGIDDGSEAVDLGQTPADIVVLSAADSELACLSHARRALGEAVPSLRLASLLHLGHNMSVDLYVESVLSGAKLVVVRLLGGRGYWPYGVEELERLCRRKGIALAFLPGDDKPDEDLARASTLPAAERTRLWRYLIHGGTGNAEHFLRFAATLLGRDLDWQEPAPLPSAGLYPIGVTMDDMRAAWISDAPVAAVVFYRALVQSANTAVVDALCMELRNHGANALPLFVTSLKDPMAAGVVESVLGEAAPSAILNATGFAVAAPGKPADTPFAVADCPVLQVVFAGNGEEGWREGARGLSSRDIAMNVALPEVDGRVLTRAVSFKGLLHRDEDTQHDVVGHKPVPDRVRFVAALAARWARLRRTRAEDRRVGLVLANYPTRDGRLGNGVGLDTPAGTVTVLEALKAAGYTLPDPLPEDGDALIRTLQEGVTNDLTAREARLVRVVLPLDAYRAGFEALPGAVRSQIADRWGGPEDDPHFRADHGGFALSVLPLGNVAVGIQPARGYNIDPVESYHDPALVPPHGYLAFYIWLREHFGAQAVIHMGKHGNLEWLPGKALALSEDCFPEAALGPMPHLYPFIVNDPGEGTQAKRRAQAVIIDHLTPPLTRAESYGPLKDLEALVDEYFEAAGVDPRRLKVLREEILSLARTTGLDDDLGISPNDDADTALSKLDAHLCELKELQIRDGLHIFGRAPTGDQRTDLLVALGRVPPAGREELAITRALAADLALADGFDPLDCPPADPWDGGKPGVLAAMDDSPWRTTGDTVERLELLARALVAGAASPDPAWTRTAAALAHIRDTLAPAVDASGDAELTGLLTGLDGRFVPPGPSGAPTRGRPDVLPTGRNFFSVDTRTVPTPAAWHLGWKSAGLLLERHWQDNGEWPRAMAITAWGTSNMRTGGDDIAQGLALMGVRPTWDTASRRVTGFEVLPASVLDRPRVDVTLRISGFFRDAFPALIDLFDSAARAVAELDEPDDINPLAARVRADAAALGGDETAARKRAAARVFGSKPGAYGAGLQAYIDEGGWDTDADLADAYITWGGYAYGAGAEGAAEHDLFRDRLSKVDAVVQNQDNREHDLLDSDDYYQFEGGMTAAVRTLSGRQPTTYHPDHSRPESPRIRTLGEEIARIVRGRAANPKWIAGVMRHGYKGAFEMAATVDYLFAFAATAKCVSDHHFDAIFDAYMVDEDVRRFLADHNPAALQEMAGRFEEAQRRDLWRSRRNDVPRVLDDIRETTKR